MQPLSGATTSPARRRGVSMNYWKEPHELASGVVPVRLVLGQCQTQQQVSAFIETVGMEGNFLQGPDEMATNVALNHVQIRKVPKRTANPFGYAGSINLGQGRENLCVAWLDNSLDAIERAAVAANVLDDLLRHFSRIEEGKLLCRLHL